MGYAVYEQGNRWAGYGVPAECDFPTCFTKINRGLAYKCESWYEYKYFLEGVQVTEEEDWDNEIEVYHEDLGCGNFFCTQHEGHLIHGDVEPKPDSNEWLEHVLKDESWERWRDENPFKVTEYSARVKQNK